MKGLPPNLSFDDFKTHFSKQFAITDAKLLSQRRIGYVGYQTHEDATRAVKYYNRSFIRMSKVTVELARSVGEQYALGPQTNPPNNSKRERADTQKDVLINPDSGGKSMRKGESAVEDRDACKFQEFLEVMQPPSKSKSWVNQDTVFPQVSTQYTSETENTTTRGFRSDEICDHVPKKRKKWVENAEEDVLSTKPPVVVDLPSVDARAIPSQRDLSQDAIQSLSTKVSAASDADWLRSRTSRLLGLADDEDAQTTALPEDPTTEKISLPDIPELVIEGSVSDASVQTGTELEVKRTIFEHEGAGNGRLFLRNLTYTATEEDLRKHFEDRGHGAIEEVSKPKAT